MNYFDAVTQRGVGGGVGRNDPKGFSMDLFYRRQYFGRCLRLYEWWDADASAPHFLRPEESIELRHATMLEW